MMNIETKYVKRKGKVIPIRIVFDGNTFTVYDVVRAKSKTKRYFSMTAVEKDFKFIEEKSIDR